MRSLLRSTTLTNKILAVDTFKQEYKAYIKQLITKPNLMDGVFNVEWIKST
jgi:hypothetical protein